MTQEIKNTRGLLAILYASAFMAGFNENMVNMALMSIMGEYGVGSVTAQWLVTGYMIMATVVVICMAFFYRRFPLRALFFAGTGFTVVGSLVCLFSSSFAMLMVGRLVQAVGSGLFIPLMMNTILAVTPKNKLGGAMATGGCMITFGPAFAPVVCGALVTVFGWHSVFFVPLIVMLVLAALGFAFVRDLPTTEAHLDLPSVALATVFLLALSFGLAELTSNALVGVVCLVVAVACAAVFVVRQLRCEHPLIDMTPMASIKFWPAVLLVVVAMMTVFSLSVLLPLYFEGALGMSAFMAGVLILLPVLLNTVTTMLGGRIMDKHGEWPLLPCGYGLMALGVICMVFAARALSAPAMLAAGLLAYAGVGLVFSPSQTAGLRTLPPQQNPFGVALMTTFVQIAACVGPALFTGVMSSVQAEALASGVEAGVACADGFASAITVAGCIAFFGFACAFVYSLAAQRRSKAAAVAPVEASAAHASGQGATVETGGRLAVASLDVVMERDPYTVSADATVREAMGLLVANHVSGMPLVDGKGAPVGYVSDGDIMRYLADQDSVITSSYAFIEAANVQTIDERLRELMALPVSSIATEKAVTLPLHTSLRDACQLLAQHRYKKLPVVDGGRVVGTVNRSDVLRYAMATYIAEEPKADE